MSPDAARVAALLLLDAPEIPAALRRSIAVALTSNATPDAAIEGRPDHRDAEAAYQFVAECKAFCLALSER